MLLTFRRLWRRLWMSPFRFLTTASRCVMNINADVWRGNVTLLQTTTMTVEICSTNLMARKQSTFFLIFQSLKNSQESSVVCTEIRKISFDNAPFDLRCTAFNGLLFQCQINKIICYRHGRPEGWSGGSRVALAPLASQGRPKIGCF